MIAELLHMTVHKLLTGEDAPLTAQEYNGWILYLNWKAEQQSKK